ncbi:MAG: hypothetical protein G01um101456_553 [Parcubacteria group bacterium Gr01-1014_56]|nr:MAG: hypothetical protein G01um101456_553 [Parcubacteria group bacterium Gr01-1014_56]
MSPQSEKNIIFLSTLKQVEMLEGFLSEHPHIREEGFLLVPLGLEIEYVLKEKGMPFESGGAYRTMDTSVMTLAEDWTASVFESERWSFFKYRGVSLSQLYFLPLQWYLSHVIYYTDIVANVLAAHKEIARLIVFSPLSSGPAMGSTLVTPQIRVIVDAVECVARENNK